MAKTFAGVEDLLMDEIKALGGKKATKGIRAVEFEGDHRCLYRVLYESRLATTVLRSLWRFTADDEHEAYRKAYACDWSRYFSVDQTFAISSTVSSDIFTHSQYISLKMKDAICDRFRKTFDRRPSVDTKSPDVRLNLHVQKNSFHISLDAAGDPLFKRGYRREGHRAPLNEILGSAMVQLSGWQPEQPFFDGMCGTGTIPIEAAMLACSLPSQYLRREFTVMNWPTFERSAWDKVKKEADDKIDIRPLHILGTDQSRNSVFTAFRSARMLDLSEAVDFQRVDFFRLKGKPESVLIMNPPYGERMGDEIEELYEKIGDRLKAEWTGSSAWLLTSNMDALKSVGLRTSKRIKLYNGPLECRFVKYEMY
ncbi:MAG: class I SAM-dependent RNA methyltransferase [Saprospiraceae bacterium]|nr:class I SAM-dependent RNA methyltransferase [Saprospiraceae bacterium]